MNDDLQRQNQIENLRQANDDLEPQEKQVELIWYIIHNLNYCIMTLNLKKN